MKPSAAFGLLFDLSAAIQFAFYPTLLNIYHQPSLIVRWKSLSRAFMSHVWVAFSGPTDEGGQPVKNVLITPHAQGVVLDIGAGHGHTAKYLDRSRVTKYIALEPNRLMYPELIKNAALSNFFESDGTLLILSCGIENTNAIPEAVDTVISVLTICSIPSPERNLTRLISDILDPGGAFLFYEHVRSPRKDVAFWQQFWTPLWSIFFGGCRLDRPTHEWVQAMKDVDAGGHEVGMWESGNVWGKPGEPDEHLFWHQAGYFRKRS